MNLKKDGYFKIKNTFKELVYCDFEKCKRELNYNNIARNYDDYIECHLDEDEYWIQTILLDYALKEYCNTIPDFFCKFVFIDILVYEDKGSLLKLDTKEKEDFLNVLNELNDIIDSKIRYKY